MIDPKNIVRYDYTDDELEELIVFCICVAGKKASTIAPRVHSLLHIHNIGIGPFVNQQLKTLGIGCYNQKAETLKQIRQARLDLRRCTIKDLESIKGIGRKTSRFFLMSSRRNVQRASLDTHVLKYLRAEGVENVPKSTPSSSKQYDRLEKEFLSRVPQGMTPAEFDLEIWKKYSDSLTPAK